MRRSGVQHCCVTPAAIVLRDQQQRVTALLLPETVQHWISDFNQARPVQPIDFEVGLPVAAVCDGYCQQNGKGGPKSCPEIHGSR